MSTATAADETRTGADALNALADSPNTRTLAAELRVFRDARVELKALTDMVEKAQEHLVERLELSNDGHLHLDGQSFTVVRSNTRSVDGVRALKAIKALRLFKRLTKVVVDESAVKALAETGLFPDLAATIVESPRKPYIKIS